MHVHGDRLTAGVAEATAAPVGVPQDDLAAAHGVERPEGEPLGELGMELHRFTVPCPGTNGGLRKTGVRLAQSLSACQWISEITFAGCSG